jgi:hypothetical protein
MRYPPPPAGEDEEEKPGATYEGEVAHGKRHGKVGPGAAPRTPTPHGTPPAPQLQRHRHRHHTVPQRHPSGTSGKQLQWHRRRRCPRPVCTCRARTWPPAQGKYTWSNGAVYEGAYADNKKQGQGKLTFPDKGVYEGG